MLSLQLSSIPVLGHGEHFYSRSQKIPSYPCSFRNRRQRMKEVSQAFRKDQRHCLGPGPSVALHIHSFIHSLGKCF